MYYIFLSVKHVKITKKMHNLPILKNNIPFVQLMSIFEKLSVIMEIVAFNDIKNKKGGRAMREKSLSKQTAKFVTGTLNKMLKVEANSTTCGILFQPKAPKALERFRDHK